MGDTDGMLTNARAAKNIPVYTDKSLIIAGKSVAEIEGAIFDVRGVVEAYRLLPDLLPAPRRVGGGPSELACARV